MVQLGFRKPTNDVVQGDSLGPDYYKVGSTATAAKMLPGIAVCKGATDFDVRQSDASGNDVGVLGYAYSPAKPATITTAYAVGDFVAVHRGASRRQMMYLASGQNVKNGQPLYVTTDGYLTAATAGTHDVYADAAESVNASGGAAAIWVVTRK